MKKITPLTDRLTELSHRLDYRLTLGATGLIEETLDEMQALTVEIRTELDRAADAVAWSGPWKYLEELEEAG